MPNTKVALEKLIKFIQKDNNQLLKGKITAKSNVLETQ